MKMTAFNNYCITCSQLIVPDQKDKSQKKDFTNIPSKFSSLYCSESCKLKDQTIIFNNNYNYNANIPKIIVNDDSTDYQNTQSLLDLKDSIITSPLLLPLFDNKNSNYTTTANDNYDIEDIEEYDCSENQPKSNNIYTTTYKDVLVPTFNDHIAENNYKLWLNKI